MMIEEIPTTTQLSDQLHISLIQQLNLTASMHEHMARKYENAPKSLHRLVLQHGVGRICKANRWYGIRRGEMKMCFKNSFHLVMLNPERFIYMEGYGVRDEVGFVVGEHAWVLDRERDFEVVDPTWRNTKGAAYLGIPFSPTYLFKQTSETRYYGLLDAYWSKWPVRRLPPQEWLHPEADKLPRDFPVPDDLADLTAQMGAVFK